ncbi:WD repeat-containing protein 93 [Megalops cyprinoides]|uniref:WD repeat-containing protein 93 n=1 Tax=Megalops cyprinoides TaxID=118141 RepID=UPI00186524E2|nr:WD repeat-containing protein 93 [Megalops cyprinoides]XP_036399826.1 WD repeat-containing protein 93 [Megalops cyprinoides]
MHVYIRKGPTDIPEPSEKGGSDDEEDTYLKDPDLQQDQLPQPFRMIDKVLNRLVDRAWEIISDREASRIAEQSKKKIPVLEATGEVKLPRRTNCLSCSEDGKYVFMGHSHGLSIICTSSLICISAWEDDSMEITSLQSTCLAEMTYLLATVDDMGVSRLFAYCPDSIYLIKIINETDDISQRKICKKLELSKGGDNGAAVMECNGTSWLEVYRFPKESWLKELEVMGATSQKQVPHCPGAADAKFSPIGVILKIKQPKALSGTSLKSPFEVLQRTENGNMIGLGQNHMITSHQWEDQDAVFKSVYKKYLGENTYKTKEAEERPSQCNFHLLLPGGLAPFLGETKSPPGVPVAICLWWSGSHNLLQYALSKTAKDKPDAEPKLEFVWPNAHHILCSATSRCTKYIALGLADGLVTIWDRHLGIPWSVLALSADSVFNRILFLDQSLGLKNTSMCQDPFHPKMNILVTCKNGTCHLITAGRGRNSHVTKLAESSTDHGTLPTVVLSLRFLLKLVLFMYRNGSVVLRDVTDGTDVCGLALPASHFLGTPWNPVFELDPIHQTLFVRGDRTTCPDETPGRDDAGSSLFVFAFREFSVMERYREALPGSMARRGCSLEETCNLYLQERAASLEDRNKAMEESWRRLQESSAWVPLSSAKPARSTASHRPQIQG